MTAALQNQAVAARFGNAAARYDDHAAVQREVAARLADRIARLPLPARPRILEIGCGTGLLTRALAERLGAADWTVTDISPGMLAAVRRGPPLPGAVHFLELDGEHPDGLPGDYDLVCASLAVQWFKDLNAGLGRLAARLAPGGWLAVSTLARGTFQEWRDAHGALGLAAATPAYPDAADILPAGVPLAGGVHAEHLVQRHAGGLAFLRGLKAIGADTPAAGHRPLGPAALRQVLARFDAQGAAASYHLAYGIWNRTHAHQ